MTQSSWELLAKNHVSGRDWLSIKKSWSAAALGFEVVEVSDLSQVLEPILAPNFEARDNVSVFDFSGGHVAAFHDAAVSLAKCAYLLRTVGNCLLGGQPTWASVDAYHFSFLAGRTLLAFLGLHFVQIKDTHCLLDVFPQGLLEQEKVKSKKEGASGEAAAKLIFRARSQVIDQNAVWKILVRAVRVARLEPKFKSDIEKICELGEGFSRSRNEILYRNSSWLYSEDFHQPTCGIAINDDIHTLASASDFFLEHRDANFAFAAIFARILSAIASDIQASSGVNLLGTSYGPCLEKFSGFKIQSIDALYMGMYRKESYGVDI